MKRVLLSWVFTAALLSSLAKPSKRSVDYTPNNVFYGVWKYEQVFHDDPMYNGISKKQFVLKLNQDGTYTQTVYVTPSDQKFYAGPMAYQLEGNWFMKDNLLYIEEHGKNYPLEISSLRDKFVYFGSDAANDQPVVAVEDK